MSRSPLPIGIECERPLLYDPANTDEKAAGIADGELIGAPWLRVRRTLFDYQVANGVRHGVHIIDIQVQPERIVFDVLRPAGSVGKMQMPAPAIFQNTVMAIVADDSEIQASVKRLARIKIAAWYDRNRTMFHVTPRSDPRYDLKPLASFGECQNAVGGWIRTFTVNSPTRQPFNADTQMVDRAMPNHFPAEPRRIACTVTAIIDAFIALALERRYDAVRVADLITRAGVGKSTFYEHFRGKDDVLLTAMRPILLALATAASGRAARSYVRNMVEHLWERRSVGRSIMDSKAAPIIQRRLADAIAAHGLGGDGVGNASLSAVGIAAAQLAMLRCWLAGHVTVTIDAMTDQLMACSCLRDANRPL